MRPLAFSTKVSALNALDSTAMQATALAALLGSLHAPRGQECAQCLAHSRHPAIIHTKVLPWLHRKITNPKCHKS